MNAIPEADPVQKITIVGRGQAGGLTWYRPEDDRILTSRKKMVASLAGLLGGRVAEELVFDDITSGASNDIERVTKIARSMVTEYGMSSRIGPMALGHKEELVFLGRDLGEQRNYSEEVAALIDEEIKGFVSEAYDKAKRILTEQRAKMDAVVERLKVEETIDAAQLDEILASPAAGSAAQVVS